MSPEIKMTLLLSSRVLVIGIPGRTQGCKLQVKKVVILELSGGREGILKAAYNPKGEWFCLVYEFCT